MKNILILSAGRRVELVESFLNEIKMKKSKIKLITADHDPVNSAACQVADSYFKVPLVDSSSYLPKLLLNCKKFNIGMIIPTIDKELKILSKNHNLFKLKKIHLILSDYNLINIFCSKKLTEKFFKNLKVNFPKIYKKKIIYPCFVKPDQGSSSIGAKLIKSKNDISSSLLKNPKMIFLEYIPKNFKEYTIDMYYDRESELKCLVPRERIEVRAGEVSKSVTRLNFVYYYILRIFKNFPGARGCITLQLFYNKKNNKIYIIEINPRFGGGFPLSYAAKANYPLWLINEYFYNNKIYFFDKWKKNLLMLRYDAKILINDQV